MSAAPPAPTTAPPAKSRAHNRFLDFVRTVAIIRVLAWHTYGFAWLSYLIASMPAMFFVAGSLMAQSLERGRARTVLYSRFRRLLIPLWAYGAVALTIMGAHAAARPESGDVIGWQQLIGWVFPIWDPQGSDWGITFWAVLWYMRCLTWLILISPILYWVFKRISVALVGLPLGLLVFFEQRQRAGNPVPWQYEDLALFGIFWVLGFAYNEGLFSRIGGYARAGLTIGFAACAALWVTTQDVPNMVVNASYPMHLFVGLAWLFFALTFEQPLNRFASRGLADKFIGWVNDRSFTIYLWHAAGLFAMYELLWVKDHPTWFRDLLAFPIVLVVTFTCMIAFGWVEDFAARRELHLAPRAGTTATPATGRSKRVAILLPVTALAGLAVLFSAALDEVFNPPPPGVTLSSAVPPSGVGIAIRAQRATILTTAPERPLNTEIDKSLPPVTGEEIQQLLDAWREENGITGAVLAFKRGSDGSEWAGASGTDVYTGDPISPGVIFSTASVTKTFTTALILQLAEEGKLNLEDRASDYIPGLAHSDDYTIRQLIQHTSGLMATEAAVPDDAILAASLQPLAFEPGTGFLYSSPGYFMLGLIIEKITGTSYTQALHERLIDPLGLKRSFMDEELFPSEVSTHPISSPAARSSSGVSRSSSRGGASTLPTFDYYGVLWSSAGLQSSVIDLARWGVELWGTNDVVSEQSRYQMTTFLPVEFQYAGLATYPFCPCWREGDRLLAERWGHYGRSGVLEYDPWDTVSFSLYTSGTDIDEALIVAYDELSDRLRELLRGRPFERSESDYDLDAEAEIPTFERVPGGPQSATESYEWTDEEASTPEPTTEPSRTPRPTRTPLPSSTPKPPTNTPTPKPTATSTPTPKPPTATPTKPLAPVSPTP